MIKQALLLTSLLASSLHVASAQRLNDWNSFQLRSYEPKTDFWSSDDGYRWKVLPGYAGNDKCMQILYRNTRVACVDYWFDLDSWVLKFTLDYWGNFIQGEHWGGQNTQMRFGRDEFTVELWRDGWYQGYLPLDEHRDWLYRWTPLDQPVWDRFHLLSIADSMFFHGPQYYGDMLGHGLQVWEMINESIDYRGCFYFFTSMNGYWDLMNGNPVRADDPTALSEQGFAFQIAWLVFNTEPHYINLSSSWRGQNAGLYSCVAQYAWQRGFRIVKAAGNHWWECDQPMPYAWNVGTPGGCDQFIDFWEDGSTHSGLMGGSSAAAAKITGWLDRTNPSHERWMDPNRWGQGEPDYCSPLGLPRWHWELNEWWKVKDVPWWYVKTGNIVTDGTGPTRRSFNPNSNTTF